MSRAEAFDGWIRGSFVALNSALEELYFAQDNRSNVEAIGDSLKQALARTPVVIGFDVRDGDRGGDPRSELDGERFRGWQVRHGIGGNRDLPRQHGVHQFQ